MPAMPSNRILLDSVSDLILLILLAQRRIWGQALAGTTRLQKLLFLLSRSAEYATLRQGGEVPDLRFRPYKMGPFTPEIYEGVELLATFEPPLIATTRSPSAETEDLEVAEYASEVDLDGSHSTYEFALRPASYDLTKEGATVATRLWAATPPEMQRRISKLVQQYGAMPLTDLLRAVYRDHKDMTGESEIKERLGLGRA